MFVDRPPQPGGLTAQRDEHLVQVPRAAHLAPNCFDVASKLCAKFIASVPDRLVTHDHATLEKQLFDVTQAQLEVGVPTNGAADHPSGEITPAT
jgi:hypothetical protein